MSKIVLKSNLQNIAFKKESAYVTRSITFSHVDANEFLEGVKRNSNLDKHVVYAASEAIGKEFENLLLKGHSFAVPGIGIFRFGVKAKAAATAEEAGAGKVYRRRIHFVPTKELKNKLKTVKFDTDIIKEDEETAGEGD